MNMLCPTCGNPVPPIEIRVDVANNRLVFQGQVVKLTPQEAILAAALVKASPHPFAKERIAHALWGHQHGPENEGKHIQVLISQLRRKLSALAVEIRTVRGEGYYIVAPKRQQQDAA